MRITPEEVLKDYEETGLEPVKDKLFIGGHHLNDPLIAACGIGVRIAAMNQFYHGDVIDRNSGWVRQANEKYGRDYIDGFIDGYDGTHLSLEVRPSIRDSERYWEGREDGEAAQEAVFSRDREECLIPA